MSIVGVRLKRIAFVYLISYLAVAAVGFGLFPTISPRPSGAKMCVQ